MNQVLADLDQAMFALEELYIEGEGEVTEETEQLEAQVSVLKELLTGEGIDLLGAWLKAKEDKKKSLKAEKDYITRQMSAIDETIDFIKTKVNHILVSTGQEKVKGARGYSFAATTSTKTEVDKELLNEWYMNDIETALVEIGIPNWVTITLGARVSDVPEGTELPACFKVTEKPSVRFTKPRASKEA